MPTGGESPACVIFGGREMLFRQTMMHDLTGGPLLYQLRTFHTRPCGPYLPICCMNGMSAAYRADVKRPENTMTPYKLTPESRNQRARLPECD